jgi:hypothetical protein
VRRCTVPAMVMPRLHSLAWLGHEQKMAAVAMGLVVAIPDIFVLVLVSMCTTCLFPVCSDGWPIIVTIVTVVHALNTPHTQCTQ